VTLKHSTITSVAVAAFVAAMVLLVAGALLLHAAANALAAGDITHTDPWLRSARLVLIATALMIPAGQAATRRLYHWTVSRPIASYTRTLKQSGSQDTEPSPPALSRSMRAVAGGPPSSTSGRREAGRAGSAAG
jgi:hypothetical protein